MGGFTMKIRVVLSIENVGCEHVKKHVLATKTIALTIDNRDSSIKHEAVTLEQLQRW